MVLENGEHELDYGDPMMRIEILLQEVMSEFDSLRQADQDCFRSQLAEKFQMVAI